MPSRTGRPKYPEQIITMVALETRDAIEAEAEEQGVSISELVREILLAHLAEQ
jgi:hypothetical protein